MNKSKIFYIVSLMVATLTLASCSIASPILEGFVSGIKSNYKSSNYEPQKLPKAYTSDKDVFMILLDGSGSMEEADKYGLVKINVAKDMIKDMALKLDKTKTNVGLVSFYEDCDRASLLVPPNNNDFSKIITASQNLKPGARTPLAYSILYSGLVMAKVNKTINMVILSDGQETCGGNPKAAVLQLKQMFGDRINVYTIGYAVDYNTEQQLKELTLGKGKYFSAKNGAKLNEIFNNITDTLKIKDDKWSSGVFKFEVNFDSGSDIIKAKYMPEVKKLAKYLKATGYSVEIQGHTDNVGDKKYNQTLSEKRALSVKTALLKNGVQGDKIYSVGYGELAPISSNKTSKGKFKNRRVEAHVIKNGNLNVDLINNANMRAPVKVEDADSNSFVGYYKIVDLNRNYKDYHSYYKIYGSGKAYSAEFFKGKYEIRTDKNSTVLWNYDKKTRKFSMDWQPGGEITTVITGNTNKFLGDVTWGNGAKGKVMFTRITEQEMECMDAHKIFHNNQCM